MKTVSIQKKVILAAALILIAFGCTREDYNPDSSFLKKVKQDGYIVQEITYNNFNLISEVNGIHFWRKFHYNDQNQLIKEEVAMNPNSLSSSRPVSLTDEFVDPVKVGISMYTLYEYDNDGLLSKQLNYTPKEGEDELRSIITFDYNDQKLISKILLHDGNAALTQLRTYQYDSNGNVTEEDYYTYLFIPDGSGPRHLYKTTFEYDNYYNPYMIFKQSGNPGIFRNLNNIIKTTTIHFDPTPGMPPVYTSETSYEYDEITRYPVRVINGEEFIYQ